ncbi:hypothetical protein [Nostoc sp. CMAA1605]|nr:hypothetical protein [Nostoc sp. CMAA1605]
MGIGDWGLGIGNRALINIITPCPMPHALCPMPHASISRHTPASEPLL